MLRHFVSHKAFISTSIYLAYGILYEQFLQVQQIGFVTVGPLRHAYRRLPRVVLL